MSSPLDALFLAAEYLEREGKSPHSGGSSRSASIAPDGSAAYPGHGHDSPHRHHSHHHDHHHHHGHYMMHEGDRSHNMLPTPPSSLPSQPHMATSLPSTYSSAMPVPGVSHHHHHHHHHNGYHGGSGSAHSPHDMHMMMAKGLRAGDFPKRSRSHSFSSTMSGKRTIKSRETHNLLEKNRRAQLKTCFDTLKDTVPCLKDGKISTVTILEQASEYIAQLKYTHRSQLDELRSLVSARERYLSMLRERGIDLQLANPGRYTQSILDPSVKVEEDEVTLHPPISGVSLDEDGDDGEGEGEGDESDEVVVDVVEDEEMADAMEGIAEPPSKRRHSVCVMEDDEEDIDIVGVSNDSHSHSHAALATAMSSVPIPIMGGKQHMAMVHTPSPPCSLGSATASDELASPGYVRDHDHDHDRDMDMAHGHTHTHTHAHTHSRSHADRSWQPPSRASRQRTMSMTLGAR